jgi:hypothetical protein
MLPRDRHDRAYVDVFLEAPPWTRSQSIICKDVRDRQGEEIEGAYEGRMVPFAPPSGISLFFNDCVDARL